MDLPSKLPKDSAKLRGDLIFASVKFGVYCHWWSILKQLEIGDGVKGRQGYGWLASHILRDVTLLPLGRCCPKQLENSLCIFVVVR